MACNWRKLADNGGVGANPTGLTLSDNPLLSSVPAVRWVCHSWERRAFWRWNMRGTLEERFWPKVDKNGPDGCWLWTATKSWNGYGLIGYEIPGTKHWEMKRAHRVAYELCVGPTQPSMQIDHICHNKGCVNPDHLRVCTISENQWNMGRNKRNTSGFKGVCWQKNNKKWQAQIKVNSKRIYLGLFNTREGAYAAYCEAATKLHGNFANFGRG